MLRRLLWIMALLAPAANAQGVFVWHQTGSTMSPITVTTYSMNAAGYTLLDTANPNTGDYAWAAGVGGIQSSNTIGQSIDFRVRIDKPDPDDIFGVVLNYNPVYGFVQGSYGVVDNTGISILVGGICGGQNMVALAALGGSSLNNLSGCQPVPVRAGMILDLTVSMNVYNDGRATATVHSGNTPVAYLNANFATNFPAGVPKFTGRALLAAAPELTPVDHKITARVVRHAFIPLCPDPPFGPLPPGCG